MKIFIVIFLALISYLIGSIPVGYLVARKVKNIDLREHGSHNIGATNVARSLGKKYGILVGLLDILKAVIVLLGIYLWRLIFKNDAFWMVQFAGQKTSYIPFFGLMTIIGHSYSIFLKFNGGKAVACSLAVVLVTEPLIGVLALLIFFIVLKCTRYVSLASLLTTFSVLVLTIIYHIFFVYYQHFPIKVIPSDNYAQNFNQSFFTIVVIGIASFLIFIKHKDNIIRLWHGEERCAK